MSQSADRLVEAARRRIGRTQPCELAGLKAAGGLVVDIRPAAQRAAEGDLPGAVVVERNVLEWRLDPTGPHCRSEATGFDSQSWSSAPKDTRPPWPPIPSARSAAKEPPT